MDKIYRGDSALVLATFPDGCIDLTVTSPPYDNLRKRHYQSIFDFEAISKQLYRVTKSGGVVVWVVGDATIDGSETLTSMRQAIFFHDVCGFNIETMIYQQAGTGAKGSNYYYWQAFEYMLVLAKGQPKTSNRIADVKNSQAGKPRGFSPKSARIGTRENRVGILAPEYSVRPNVWVYAQGQNDKTDHPAPFPEKLAKDHILSWSNPGDIVLDCFCGSGTTLKMAKELGRHYIGIDVSKEYCDMSQKRVDGARVPLFN